MPKEIFTPDLGNVTVYTPEEAAELLGISADMVGLYINTGEVKGQKLKDHYYIDPESLKARQEGRKAPDEGAKGAAREGGLGGMFRVAAIAGAVVLLLIALIGFRINSAVKDDAPACDTAEVRELLIKEAEPLMAPLIEEACSATEEGGDADVAYLCSEHEFYREVALGEHGVLEDVEIRFSDTGASFCRATLRYVVPMGLEYSVARLDGGFAVSISGR